MDTANRNQINIMSPAESPFAPGSVQVSRLGGTFLENRIMKLLTKEITKRLPALRAQEHVEDPIVHLKLFTPWSNWTWFITEYDPVDRLFFGMVHGLESEIGYISQDELEQSRGPGGLTIERDLHFKPQPLSECKNPCAV